MKSPHIKIALLGMDKRSAKILKMSLEQNSPQGCEVIDAASLAIVKVDMAFVDLDAANYHEELLSLKKYQGEITIIATSIKQSDNKYLYFLRKPLSISCLLDLMKQIYVERITKQAAGDGIASNVKSDPARISNTVQKKQKTAAVADILVNRTQNNRAISKSYSVADNLFFEPSQYTISYVLKAIAKSCKSKKQVMVHLWGGKTILIDAAQGRILTDISNSQMRPLGIAAINNSNTKVKIKTADTAEIVDFSPRINDAIRVTGIDEFLWHLGFITARGRSPKSLDNNVPFNLQKPVYINEWPNFTRLAPIPHAIQIVAYWIQQPTSLSDLSKHLQVDAEYISGLFFACHSIGIAGQTHHHADNIVERKCTVKHKHRSLFGAILDHLKFNG